MTSTAIINNALRLLGVIRTGQTAATAELADGLAFLNQLVDNWSTERLLLPFATFVRYALTAAKSTYTIGPSGAPDITAPRPLRVDAAGIVQLAYNLGSADFRSPLDLLSEREWVAIRDKTATADVPKKLYYAPTVANGTLYLWPIPNVSSATSLELTAWGALVAWPDLTTDEPIAPGYERALVYNLALDMGDKLFGSQVGDVIANGAREAKASIMKLNSLMVPETPVDVATPPATDVQFQPVPAVLGSAVRMAQPNVQGAFQAAQAVSPQR